MFFLLVALSATRADNTNAVDASTNDTARFSDQPAPLDLATFPDRPAPLIEWGDKFLGNGNLQKGITLPTGEVISPNFWVFGNYRTAMQTFDNGGGAPTRITEWANRLDIFGNLQFSATERILVGWRPLDRFYPDGTTDYTGYRFEPKSQQGFQEAFSSTPRALFFEGELGEIFPTLDQHDKKNLDYGFSVGRQPLTLQDGILANDSSVDMITITRNSLLIPGGSTLRLSGLFTWGQMDRQRYSISSVPNAQDAGALLYGLDAAADFPLSTVEGDVLYETSSSYGNQILAGIGSIQRIGKLDTTFRVNTSEAISADSRQATSGTLFTAHLSYTLPSSVDLLYMDGFWGIDRFSSAARDQSAGGPLGAIGILTAAPQLGIYGAPLSNQADHSAGGAIGYQRFFGELRREQLIVELGGRAPTQTPSLLRQQPAGGIGVRYEQAFGRRFVLILDTFGVIRDNSAASAGGRIEWLTKF